MHRKVIVIGLDGLDPGIVETMLAHDELPNLAKIRKSGTYSRLATTYPAQTPVAWSSFAMGTNPGGHGIFDFISRDPQTYLPDAALSRFERAKSMLAQPRAVNQRKGVPVWQVLTQAGVPSTVLRCPCTFPAEALQGRMLAVLAFRMCVAVKVKERFTHRTKQSRHKKMNSSSHWRKVMI